MSARPPFRTRVALTATIASHFVKTESSDADVDILQRLDRIEQALRDLHAVNTVRGTERPGR